MFAKIGFFGASQKFAPTPLFISALLVKPPIKENLDAIYSHSFNRELFKGTLKPQIFCYYLRNDDYYLQKYALVLLALSKKTNKQNPALSTHLSFLASDTLADETAMQRSFQKYYDLCPDVTPPGPAIKNYVDFLNQLKDKPVPVALSGILPCFWTYYQLGKKNKLTLVNNPYKNWTDSYSSKVFSEATETLVAEINEIAKTASPVLMTEMEVAFQEAVQHELHFFNESYNSKELGEDHESLYPN